MKIHTYIGSTPKAKRAWKRWIRLVGMAERGHAMWSRWKDTRFRKH